jgi:putative NADH-flavin reductase
MVASTLFSTEHAMNVALIGATGFIGGALLEEAVRRGRRVTAIARDPAQLAPRDGSVARRVDVADTEALADALRGHAAVLSAHSGHSAADVYGTYVAGFESIRAATKAAGVPRLLLVGGAASLQVAPGVELLDTPRFPAQWRDTARGAREALMRLRADAGGLDWTVLSPSAMIAPGERTGRFRLGDDALLVDASGESRISVQDYAVAMLDELESPKHSLRRFTVGY